MQITKVKKIVVVISTLLFCAAMLAIYFLAIVPPKSIGKKYLTLTIKYSDAEYVYEGLVSETETVFDFVKEYDEKLKLGLEYENSAFGAYVTGFKDTLQNTEKGYYYTFKINDVSAEVGVSAAPIADGDNIVFEYGHATYGEDFTMLSYELAPCGTQKSSSVNYKTPAQIAVIAVGSAVAALSLGVAIYFLVKGRSQKSE